MISRLTLIISFSAAITIVFINLLISKGLSQYDKKNSLKQVSNKGNRLAIITYLEGREQGKNGRLGYSVAGIGDVNLDGFDDVLIGNPDNGPGEAWLLFGGAPMDSMPDLILRGENDNDLFGSTVAGGEDINGDGAPDFLVSAFGYTPPGSYEPRGRVYVYFGGALLDTIPDLVITGEPWDNIGSNALLADVNGDGCADILLSCVNPQHERGKVWLYYGGNELDTIPDWTNTGDSVGTYLGGSIAVGDVNGDGKQDIFVISSPGGYGTDAMTVTEIFLNKAGFDTIPDYSLVYPLYGDATEDMVLCADFNQDGTDDFLTDYYGYKIYYGSHDLDLEPDATLDPWPYTYVMHFRNAGDVNGDGYPDILGGAPKYIFETGTVQLWLGSKNINPTVDWIASGNGVMGYGLDGAGDVNGDGYDDLIVSDIIFPFTSISKSYVYILAGNAKLKDFAATNVATQTEPRIPNTFKLKQNYPNPLNNQTTISYELSNIKKQPVKLVIYNVNGKEIITLVDSQQHSGKYKIHWNGKDKYGRHVNSGIYFCILKVGTFHQMIKMLLVK